MDALPDRLAGKRLYIADLAARIEAMESGRAAMDPLAYRLFARRMARALAGYPEPLAVRQLGRVCPSVIEALAQRHFDARGEIAGDAGVRAARVAASLFRTLAVR